MNFRDYVPNISSFLIKKGKTIPFIQISIVWDLFLWLKFMDVSKFLALGFWAKFSEKFLSIKPKTLIWPMMNVHHISIFR